MKSNYRVIQARGGQTFRTKSRIEKNFEAEGRTDWKNKVKKVITSAGVLFSTQKQAMSNKKSHRVRRCPILQAISVKNKVYISLLAHRMRPAGHSLPTPVPS